MNESVDSSTVARKWILEDRMRSRMQPHLFAHPFRRSGRPVTSATGRLRTRSFQGKSSYPTASLMNYLFQSYKVYGFQSARLLVWLKPQSPVWKPWKSLLMLAEYQFPPGGEIGTKLEHQPLFFYYS